LDPEVPGAEEEEVPLAEAMTEAAAVADAA